MKLGDAKDLVMIGAIIYVVYWLIKNKEKFDPTSDKNAAYQAASAVVREASGGKYQTVGDWLYGMFGSNDLDPIQFEPYTKADGTQGARVSRVARMRDGKLYRVDYSGDRPRLLSEDPSLLDILWENS